MMRRWITLALGAALLVACGPTAEEQQADREAIQATLEAYLPRLAEAYATGNVEALRGVVVEKELARVARQVEEAAAQGRVLEPRLHEFTIEDLSFAGPNNAYVTTLEVWDVRSYALGSERQLGESLDRAERVKYQVTRREEGWKILARFRLDAGGDGGFASSPEPSD